MELKEAIRTLIVEELERMQLAARGEQGEQGERGERGEKGEQGPQGETPDISHLEERVDAALGRLETALERYRAEVQNLRHETETAIERRFFAIRSLKKEGEE